MSVITQPESTIESWSQLLIICPVLLLLNPPGNVDFPLRYPLEVIERAGWESGLLILQLEVTHDSVSSTGLNILHWQQGCDFTLEWSTASRSISFQIHCHSWGWYCVSIDILSTGLWCTNHPNKETKINFSLCFTTIEAFCNPLNYIIRKKITILKSPTLQMRGIRLRGQLWATFPGHTTGCCEGGSYLLTPNIMLFPERPIINNT